MNQIQERKIRTKGRKNSIAATQLKAASYGAFSHKFCFILKNMTYFIDSLNVALEWYIKFLIKQWCKALKGRKVSLKKWGTRRLPRYPSPISIPVLAISLVGKAHVTKMKLNL